MRELDRRIATLRLRLAEISAREEQIRSLQRQYRSQLDKLMDFAIYERGDLGSALSMADEVDSRLAEADRTLGYLKTIQARGKEELEALLLTSSIEAAKADVAELEAQIRQLDDEMGSIQGGTESERRPAAPAPKERLAQLRAEHEKLEAEVQRLRHDISEASDEAARTVSGRARSAGDRATEAR